MKNKKLETMTFNEKLLQDELEHNARAVGLSTGAAQLVAEKVVKRVSERVTKRAAITTDDLNRFVAEEAEKFNKDLAYVYKNRGKII